MCNFSKKNKAEKKSVPEWNLDLRRLMGIARLLYSFFPIAQDMHKIIVLSSICKICASATLYGSMSIFRTSIGDENLFELSRVIRQVGGKLQIVQVGEGFELNCSGDIEAQLYFCSSKALTQSSTRLHFIPQCARCVQHCTFFLYLTYSPMFQI